MLRSEPISLLSGSCTELQANVQARVYFQLKRRRRRRRRRRESSLQGGEQRSRWLRGESTFLWKQLPVSSHSLLSKKNPPKVLQSDRHKQENVGLLSFLQNTQRLHSVGSSHLSPGSHTNQRLGDDVVAIYTRAGQATPPRAADPIAERQGRHFEAVSQSPPSLSLTERCFVT